MNWPQTYTRLRFQHGWIDERYTRTQEFPLGPNEWLQHLQCKLNIKTKFNVKCFQQRESLDPEYCRGYLFFIFKCVRMYFSRGIQVDRGECEHGRWQFF